MRVLTRALCLAVPTVLVWASLGLTQAAPTPTVTVLADGQTYQVSSAADSVGQLLTDLGLTLGDLDRTTPAPTSRLAEGLVIRVTRVARHRVVEDVPVERKTVLLPVTGRATGFTKILAEGRDGLVRRVTEVWEKDGQPARRKVVQEKVLIAREDRVIMRSVTSLPSRGGDYRRPRRMRATAYDPGPRSCGPYADGRTANGMKAQKGVVAVDTRVIPFGTRLYIPGYGFAIAADRGSAIKGNRIDLCFNTYEEAIRFGTHWVDVYILPKSS